jgi:hypothetical protein
MRRSVVFLMAFQVDNRKPALRGRQVCALPQKESDPGACDAS